MNFRLHILRALLGSTSLLVIASTTQALAANQVIDAAELYHDYCSVCHGDKGDGRSRAQEGLIPPPRDFTAPTYAAMAKREQMIDIVLHGKAGTAMSAWQSRLNHEQAAAIVDYIRTNFMHASTVSHPVTAGDSPADRDIPAHAHGAQIYAASCSVCHGDDGAGAVWASSNLNPPPRDFTKTPLARERILASITHGREGTAMPSFTTQLTSEDIAAVADYILATFSPKTAMSSTATDSAQGNQQNLSYLQQTMPHDLKGNVTTGEAFYRFNCATCHGDQGDGKGPRAYFIFPKPRNFLSEGARQTLNRPTLFNATKNGVIGKEMPAWGKVLNDQQIADVVEYVYQAFIKPTTASGTVK